MEKLDVEQLVLPPAIGADIARRIASDAAELLCSDVMILQASTLQYHRSCPR